MTSCCVDPTAATNWTTAAMVTQKTAGTTPTVATGKLEYTNAFIYGRPLPTERKPCTFLPRDDMRKRGICCGPSVRHPSVCLSVCHVRAFYQDG